ncbi:MAG: hypothetical protein K2Y39_26355 [Candidatus Obscuribacterales bacterium]|nr:hypothetical protein [Candidatus Obscuribacterales bacterium]
MSELTFRADAETLKILEKVGLGKKDDFINRAVQAYATGGGAFDYASGSANSASALSLSDGLTAGLGGSSASLSSLTSSVSPTAAVNVGSDPASQLNAELDRLLGPAGGVTCTLVGGNPQMVEFFQGGSKIASLELSECQSILKSLRPPISLAEVVEMLTLMSVG